MRAIFKKTSIIVAAVVLSITTTLIPPAGLGSFASAAGCSTVTIGGKTYYYNPRVGGVSLDQAATFLADMSDITGSYYDNVNDRIVFVGKTETGAPKFDKDDLAVAIKSVIFNGTNPQVNINFAADPTKLDVSFFGGIENTRFGKVLFDADYKLKLYMYGYNPNGQPLSSNVPGYKSHFQRYLEKNPNPNHPYNSSSRFWISPQNVTLKRDTNSNSFVFDQTTMQVQTEPLSSNNQWQWNQAASEFAAHQTAYYDQYATETPAFYDAKQLAKIVGVVKWIKDNNILSDFQWARDYTPQYVSTPTQIDKVVTPQVQHNGYLWQLEGGVLYDKANTYVVDSGFASSLKSASQAANSNIEDVHWEFTHGGQTYDSVSVAAEAFMSLGSYGMKTSDLSIPMAGKLDMKIERSYSSFTAADKGFGRGWDIMPGRMTNLMPGAVMTCDGGVTYTNFPLRVSIQLNDGLYETFSYNCATGYTPDKPNYHGKLVRDPSGYYTYTSKDLTNYLFDSSLQFMRMTDNNGVGMNYTTDSNGRLTEIEADSGQKLILTYNSYGKLSTVEDWTGREVYYLYGPNNILLAVIDPRGGVAQYEYDTNYRLTTVKDRHQVTVLTNTYNADSRLSTQTDDTGNTKTFTYDNSAKKITAIDTNGRTDVTFYDDEARVTQQKDTLNNTVNFGYTGLERTPTSTTDKRGSQTTNTLDSNGNVTSTTLPDGKTISYEYNTKNQVIKITDGRYGTPAKETTNTYDSAGNLTQKNEAGRVTSYGYDVNGDMTSQVGQQGDETTWTRDNLGNTLTEKNPLDQATTFERDTLGRLTKKTDPQGVYHSYTYDANNNLLTDTTSIGTTTNQYSNENRLYKTIQPNGSETELFYYTTSSLAAVEDAQGHFTSYAYDDYQNLITKQNALEKLTEYEYDGLNRKTRAETPSGKVRQWEYDANGNITARVDAANQRTTYEYDVLNRLKKVTYPDTTTATYTYDYRGNLTQSVDQVGTTSYTYDIYDRLTNMAGPNSSNIQYTYDANDNVKSVKYPDNKEVKYLYDPANQLRSVIDWNGETTSYQYNKNGQLKSRRLPNNISSRYSYDSAGRSSGLHHVNGTSSLAKFTYGRDVNGRVTSKTEHLPAAVTRQQIYDEGLATGWQNWSWGSTVGLSDTTTAYRGTKSLKWKGNSAWAGLYLHNNTFVNTQNYQSLSFTAKATNSNQPVTIQLYNSSLQESGPAVNLSDYGGAPEPSGFTNYSIPVTDLVTGTDKNVSGVAVMDDSGAAQQPIFLDTIEFNNLPSSAPFEKVYTDAKSPTWEDWSWGSTISFANTTNIFNGAKSISWAPGSYGALNFHHDGGRNTTGYESLSFAIKGSAADQNVVVQLYDQNENELGDSINIAKYGGNPTSDGYKLYEIPLADLDGANTVISGFYIMNDTESTQPALFVDEVKLIPAEPPTIAGATTSYTYDAVGRLLSATYPGNITYSYTYDAAGNRLTSSEAGTSKTQTFDMDNKLTAVSGQTYTYNNNGSLTNNGAKSFTYTHDNYLKTVTDAATSATTTYGYDSLGNRISRTSGGATTYYVNDVSSDLTQVLATKNSSGAITDYYVYGTDLLSQGGSNKTDRQYYLDDGLGDVRFVTNYNGSTYDYLSYGPYGTGIGSAGSADFQFRGEAKEPDSGLVYLRARYYNPATGTFISQDPVDGVLTNPESQNGYSYAHNDPVNLSDPSGELVPFLIGAGLVVWALYDMQQAANNCDSGGFFLAALGLVPIGRIAKVGSIIISAERAAHVVNNHTIAGVSNAGKSIFNKGTDVKGLIERASSVAPKLQSGGNYQRVVDAGRVIGTDRVTGRSTSVYTVITNSRGELVTAFPGRP